MGPDQVQEALVGLDLRASEASISSSTPSSPTATPTLQYGVVDPSIPDIATLPLSFATTPNLSPVTEGVLPTARVEELPGMGHLDIQIQLKEAAAAGHVVRF